jgi:hypothetical protein
MRVFMQMYADIYNRPLKVCASKQTCALGAALFGAVAGGVYPTAEAAQKKMSAKTSRTYKPNPEAAKVYAELYALYETLHDAFGLVGRASPRPPKPPPTSPVTAEAAAPDLGVNGTKGLSMAELEQQAQRELERLGAQGVNLFKRAK